MHVSPSTFRTVRRDGILLHFAVLGDVAYAIAEFPSDGSRGTFIEAPCREPHWGFVVQGSLEIDLGSEQRSIAQGSAFHVPEGLDHRLLVPGRARLAGFSVVKPDAPRTDAQLRKAGYEVMPAAGAARRTELTISRVGPERPPDVGEIVSDARRMGDLLYMRSRLGPRAGYTGEVCDAPHWGLVAAGNLAIESEDDIEVLTAGDVYFCPAGPPGHRFQAADPATIVDFTPIAELDAVDRVPAWRRDAAAPALAEPADVSTLEVTAIV